MDVMCLTETFLETHRPPITAMRVQRLWPRIVPNAITGTDWRQLSSSVRPLDISCDVRVQTTPSSLTPPQFTHMSSSHSNGRDLRPVTPLSKEGEHKRLRKHRTSHHLQTVPPNLPRVSDKVRVR